MKENFVIRLVKKLDDKTVDTEWVILKNGEGFTETELKLFSRTRSYSRKSLVIYKDTIYKAVLDTTPGPWNPNQWKKVDNAYAEVSKYDKYKSYPEDSLVYDRAGNILYSVGPIQPGVMTNWINIAHGTIIFSAYAYFPEVSKNKPEIIQGKIARIYDPSLFSLTDPEGDVPNPEEEYVSEFTDKVLAYYDANDLTTLSTTLAEGNIPELNDRIAFIRDISGNGNHAIQLDVNKRPLLKRDQRGNYYVRFNPGTYMETKKSYVGKTNQYVAIAGRGVPRFETEYNGRIRIGIKSERTERFWAWAGECVVPLEAPTVIQNEVRTRMFKEVDEYYWNAQATFYHMFAGETTLRDGLHDWRTQGITDWTGMFDGATNFNDDLSSWNTAGVRITRWMFRNCEKFNSDISGWNMSSLVNATQMFFSCDIFNQDISRWDVSSLDDASGMLRYCPLFAYDISGWDVSNVTNFDLMLDGAVSFNQPIGNWDVSSATSMAGMVANIPIFDQDLSSWCVEKIPVRPAYFAVNSPIDLTAKEPQWGQPCNTGG